MGRPGGRRSRGGCGAGHQPSALDPPRLQLSASLPRGEGAARRRQQPHRPQRRGSGGVRPTGHHRAGRRQLGTHRGTGRGQRPGGGRPGGAGGAGQRPLRLGAQPGPDAMGARRGGRGPAHRTRAQADRGRRPGGRTQRRQVDPARERFGGPAEGCGVSLYHPRSQPGGGQPARLSILRAGGHPRDHRGRPRGEGPGAALPAPCRTHAHAGLSDSGRLERPPGGVRAPAIRAAEPLPRAGREGALPGGVQDGPGGSGRPGRPASRPRMPGGALRCRR